MDDARAIEIIRQHHDAASNGGPKLTEPAPWIVKAVLAAVAAERELLDALRDECWDLRCFDRPTGGGDADVGWRVVGHWEAEPHERTIAEAYSDDPRDAIRAAIALAAIRSPQ